LRLVAFSIASTRSSVGSTTGRKSVQRFSTNSAWRFSSVSGSRKRGVERSIEAPCSSVASSGLVNPSMISCMNGRSLTGSVPSM